MAPLLEEASANVPPQMHRAAAAEEESASLSVKGRGVGLGIYRARAAVCLQIFWRATTHPAIYHTRASDHIQYSATSELTPATVNDAQPEGDNIWQIWQKIADNWVRSTLSIGLLIL